MNPLRLFLSLFSFLAVHVSVVAEGIRTDINPALLYWQAQGAMPTLSDTEHGHLFTNRWFGRALDPQFSEAIVKYDPAFRLLQSAARQTVPCDWGYDLTEGPDLELPSLAPAKSLIQTARLRFRWRLERGEPTLAREEWLASLVLTRSVSKDGILISALVQFAMENILTGAIAENWHRLETPLLEEIVVGIKTSPARGSVAECIPGERMAFKEWLERGIEKARARTGKEKDALAEVKVHLRRLSAEDPTLADRVLDAAGGTTAGLLRYLEPLDALYAEAESVMALPYDEFLPAIEQFNARVAAHPNLLVHVFFPLFEKCRVKEYAVDVKTTMIIAAVEYRKSGLAGLGKVLDPTAKAPFKWSRFVLDGVDRGFQLQSHMDASGWVETLIFVETDGSPFQVEGKNAGKVPE